MIEESIEPAWGRATPDPRESVQALLKRWWIIVVVTLAFGGGAWAYADRQAPVYESTSKLVIDTSSPRILSDVAPVVDTGGQSFWAIREYLETQYRILGSSVVAAEVAQRLGVANDPAFLGLGGIEDPAELAAALEHADPARSVLSRITVEPVEDSRVVSVRARAGTPQMAASLANTTAEVYIERNLARQLESTDTAATWLQDQYSTLQANLTESEAALVAFRQENDLVAVELAEHVSLTSRMEETSRQLSNARLEADRATSIVRQIDDAVAAGNLLESDVSVIVDNELIQSLKAELYAIESERIELASRYLEAHPLMESVIEREALARDRLSRELDNVLGAQRRHAERARSLVSTLESRLRGVEDEVQQLGTHQVEYAALLREAEANRELFDLIERRLKEVEITRNSQHNNVELLEAAIVPMFPVSPNRPMIVAVGAAAGLFFAVLLALVLEAADRTVANQEVLEREFGLAFLGVIPRIRRPTGAKATSRGPARGDPWSPDTYAHDYPKSALAESCRSIRTNLMFLASEQPLEVMVVTSPGPQEGKTTTCMNIATVMAQAGLRVLLVDGDMRRPRVHKVHDTPNEVGLSSVLTGEIAAVDAIQRTPAENLDILPIGPIPANPTELMESARFRSLLEDLSSMYDRVLFDSPPVSPVTDAAILGSIVDGVLLVVRANATRRETVRRTVEKLRAVNANIVGAVLNDVDTTKRRGGGYYYSEYSAYYGDETAA